MKEMKDFAVGALIGAFVGGAIVAKTRSKSCHHYIEIRGPRVILNSSHAQNGIPMHGHKMGHMHHHGECRDGHGEYCSHNGHHHMHNCSCPVFDTSNHPDSCRCHACSTKNHPYGCRCDACERKHHLHETKPPLIEEA